jgi:amino acid adenylation domain-containing protein
MTLPIQNPAKMPRAEQDQDPAVHAATQIKKSWTGQRTDYPRDKTIAQLFEEVASKYPERIATVGGSQKLSYAELNSRANSLAVKLRHAGVAPGTMVGCCIERSVEMIIALVAVLKAGGAYVPLDPSYPKQRLDSMLAETCAPVMLCQRSLIAKLGNQEIPAIYVDDMAASGPLWDTRNPESIGAATDLAYVMYTSGSTGQPKGVMVENRAVVRLVRNTNFCTFGPEEVFLQFAPVSFDASTLEIWGPLLNGGTLVLMPSQAASLEDIGRTIREHGVTAMWLTSGLFNLMVEQRLDDLRPIRQLLAGGDVLSSRHVRKVLENLPDCTVINGYGPTENTTFTCCHVMRRGDTVPESVPIGKPVSNSRAYILDEDLRPVPAGTAGELYAGGDGVARGYLKDAIGTAEKFVPDPFSDEPNARMYRTGDLARWRHDGVVEFLGRIDNQVKIHGYRIEPGEIELALRTHRMINQACVVPWKDENGLKRLVGYFTTVDDQELASREVKQFLSGKVPAHMVPALFVRMEALPLSPNGKVDRAAFRAPVFEREESPAERSTAAGLEGQIAEVWKRVLRAERVGLDDNFFDLGGDSLLLLAVHSNLQKGLQIEIPITDLFEFTTVRTLAVRLNAPQSTGPSFSEVQQQAQKQRDAFARERKRHSGGAS